MPPSLQGVYPSVARRNIVTGGDLLQGRRRGRARLLARPSLPPVALFDNYWATTLAFAKSLGEKKVPLHLYGRGAGRWSRHCTRHFPCPPIENAREFEPWLSEQIRTGRIARIAPTTDLVAYYVSKLRDEFPADARRTIAPLAEIETCLIKTRFATACAVPGQPVLTTLAPTDLDGAIAAAGILGYPVILKPKSHLVAGFYERGRLVRDVAELRANFRRYDVVSGQEGLAETYPELRWPVMQRYVPSARHRVYSVSGFKDADGGVLAAAVSFKTEQWPPDVGVSTVQIACTDERILQTGLQVVNRLLSRGIFEIELLVDAGNLYAIDLNPRAFGFVALDMARGIDLPWLWYSATLGHLPQTALQPSLTALEARHKFVNFLRRVVNGRSDGNLLPQNLPAPSAAPLSVPMLGDWSDPLPMLLCHLQLLKHPRSLLRARRPTVSAPVGDWSVDAHIGRRR